MKVIKITLSSVLYPEGHRSPLKGEEEEMGNI